MKVSLHEIWKAYCLFIWWPDMCQMVDIPKDILGILCCGQSKTKKINKREYYKPHLSWSMQLYTCPVSWVGWLMIASGKEEMIAATGRYTMFIEDYLEICNIEVLDL